MKKFIFYFPILLLAFACSRKISLNSQYFKSSSSVGIIVRSHKIENINVNSRRYTAITNTHAENQYTEPLKIIEAKLNVNDKVKQMYVDLFSSQGKKLVMIEEKLEAKTFNDPGDGKKYSSIDVRYLKDKYNIQEVLICYVRYGLVTTSAYGMETSRRGWIKINTVIVNETDNSLLYKDNSRTQHKIKGKWNIPPEYQLLQTEMNKTIDESVIKEKGKFKKMLISKK